MISPCLWLTHLLAWIWHLEPPFLVAVWLAALLESLAASVASEDCVVVVAVKPMTAVSVDFESDVVEEAGHLWNGPSALEEPSNMFSVFVWRCGSILSAALTMEGFLLLRDDDEAAAATRWRQISWIDHSCCCCFLFASVDEVGTTFYSFLEWLICCVYYNKPTTTTDQCTM